jgi:hypothetical protein
MMMKKTMLFSGMLFVCFLSNAQFNVGLKAGINLNNMNFKSSYFLSEEIGIGPQAGAFARLNIWKMFVQAEALYSEKNGTYMYSPEPYIDTIFNTNHSYLDIPLHVGVSLFDFLRISTGPMFSTLLKENVSYKAGEGGESVVITDPVFKKNAVSWYSSVGVDYGKFFLGVSMEQSLGNIHAPFSIPQSSTIFEIDGGRRIFSFYVGMKLFAEDESI